MATKQIKLNIKSKDSDDTSTPPPPPPGDYESSDDEKETQGVIPKSPAETPPSSMQTPPELLKEMDEKEKMAIYEPTTPDTPPEILRQLEEQKKDKVIEKKKRDISRKRDIFIPIVGETNITLPLKSVGKNLKEKISKNLAIKLEGKCSGDGFVKSDSLKITTYSNGLLVEGNIKYKVIYEAYVCNPVEGHLVECTVNNVTKAGIRATVSDGEDTPLVIFIARDHHYNDSNFLSVREGDNINVRVIGTRFELNDAYIAIIGELVKQKKTRITIKK